MTIDLENQTARESDETLTSLIPNVELNSSIVKELISLAEGTTRGRIRLCAHMENDEHVHEMFIVHPQGAYIQPHKHLGKSESLLILSGETDYFIFDDDGSILRKIVMGDYQSEKCFFFRLQEPLFHSMIIRSKTLIFLEITKGPFRREDTVLAEWAPNVDESDAVANYFNVLSHWRNK